MDKVCNLGIGTNYSVQYIPAQREDNFFTHSLQDTFSSVIFGFSIKDLIKFAGHSKHSKEGGIQVAGVLVSLDAFHSSNIEVHL